MPGARHWRHKRCMVVSGLIPGYHVATSDLQETGGEDGRDTNLPRVCHLQIPDGDHGQDQYQEIRQDVPCSNGNIIVLDTDAVTRGQWIPDLLSWRTGEDLQECLDCVEEQIRPDEYMDAVEDEVALVCHENSFEL